MTNQYTLYGIESHDGVVSGKTIGDTPRMAAVNALCIAGCAVTNGWTDEMIWKTYKEFAKSFKWSLVELSAITIGAVDPEEIK